MKSLHALLKASRKTEKGTEVRAGSPGDQDLGVPAAKAGVEVARPAGTGDILRLILIIPSRKERGENSTDSGRYGAPGGCACLRVPAL